MKDIILVSLFFIISFTNCNGFQTNRTEANASSQIDGSKVISGAHARDDLDQMIEIINTTHPNLAFSANQKLIVQRKDVLKKSLVKPLTVSEFWQVASQLNPLFNDAHVGVRYPVSEFENYQYNGGLVFPIPIYIYKGKILVSSKIGAMKAIESHDEILSINNIRASSIFNDLKTRMRGETKELRNFIISRNFPAYFWTLYGKQHEFTVKIKTKNGKIKSLKLLEQVNDTKNSLEDTYKHKILNGNVGYLMVKSFNKSLKNEFSDFLKSAYKEFDDVGIEKLIIDIRDNPGGAHNVSDMLISYLTNRPVSATSALTARIIKENLQFSPQSKIGDTITIPFQEPIKTEITRPSFEGDVYLLVNSNTYSQGIVFAVTVRDNNLAKIVGEKTSGNANQSGQVQMVPLKNSGLLVASPIYLIFRPNGDRKTGSLKPDIEIKHNRQNPSEMITSLLKKI